MAQTGEAPVLSGYFVSINSQPSGPFDTAGLRQLIGNGQLTRDSLVWKEGMANWAVASSVAELAPLFPAGPPPLPPPLSSSPPPLPSETTPQQAASQSVPREPWGSYPFIAGSINTAFGIWSFTNSDISGGLLTAGLQTGGVALAVVGLSLYSSWYPNNGSSTVALIMYYAGYGVVAAGGVYGFVRGFTQYNRKMATARSFAEALCDNPLNNISLVTFPISGGKSVTGALTYSLAY